MNDLIHTDVARQVSRDRQERLVQEARTERLAREASSRRSRRSRRPALAVAWTRLRAERRAAQAPA